MAAMGAAMRQWGPDAIRTWAEGSVALGQCLLVDTPEARYERQPALTADRRWAFTSESRLDNRDDLLDLLDIASADRSQTPDGELVRRAHARWGDAAPVRVLGDWSCAAVDLSERSLFLSRDHYGRTALYYSYGNGRLAFASDRRALLALPGIDDRINEPYLAKVLVGWPGHGGPDTIVRGISRLPPAHALRAGPGGLRLWRYWDIDDTPPIRLASDGEYVDAFTEYFRNAVRSRLRSTRPVGVLLSGGLDSSAIAAMAADIAAGGAGALTAFTARPRGAVPPVRATQIVDEWPLAHAVAAGAGIPHLAVAAERPTPLDGLGLALSWHGEPIRAAGHQYWIAASLQAAQAAGVGVLLDGHAGNATISWPGRPVRRGWRAQALVAMPRSVRHRLRLWRRQRIWRHAAEPWRVLSPIHPEFARRVRLEEEAAAHGMMLGAGEPWAREQDARRSLLNPGGSMTGTLAVESAVAHGLESRDPSADIRLLSFVWAIPDAQFQGPPSRWLLRRAMAGRLPDEVRLNHRRGVQAADLVARLRNERARLNALLAALAEAPPVREYLDIAHLGRAAAALDHHPEPLAADRARTVLMRGLAAGLYLSTR
jgi:asparagine synthase (glutamine-hydrolysing)